MGLDADSTLRGLGYEEQDGVWVHQKLGWMLRHPDRMARVDPDTLEALHGEQLWQVPLAHPRPWLEPALAAAVVQLQLRWVSPLGLWGPTWSSLHFEEIVDGAARAGPVGWLDAAGFAVPPPFFRTEQLQDLDAVREALEQHRRLRVRMSALVGTAVAAVGLLLLWLLVGWVVGLEGYAAGVAGFVLAWLLVRFGPWPDPEARWLEAVEGRLGPAWREVMAAGEAVRTAEGDLWFARTGWRVDVASLAQLEPREVVTALRAIR